MSLALNEILFSFIALLMTTMCLLNTILMSFSLRIQSRGMCFFEAGDNHVFVEYHPYVFFAKDPITRNVLLRGRCKGGLYPFPSLELSTSTSKCVLCTVKTSITRWHERLGHPSMVIMQHIFDDNKLACSRTFESAGVCDACQCAKSHQLSFPRSLSVSKAPLELVF
jgi:hypothetical protein